MFSDHAKAQEANGFRLGDDPESKYDAAHLMNTTLNVDDFKDVALSDKNLENLEDLYRATAATTNQFQTSNVSADKIVDSAQTIQKQKMLAELSQGATLDAAFLQKHLDEFLNDLVVKLQGGLPAAARKAFTDATAAGLDPLAHPALDASLYSLKEGSYVAALRAVVGLGGDRERCLGSILDEIGQYCSQNLV